MSSSPWPPEHEQKLPDAACPNFALARVLRVVFVVAHFVKSNRLILQLW